LESVAERFEIDNIDIMRKIKKVEKDIEEVREEVRELIGVVIDYYNMPFSVEYVLTRIFEEERGEIDRRLFVSQMISYVNEPERLSATYALFNQAWYFFPHHFLNGKAPVELVAKE